MVKVKINKKTRPLTDDLCAAIARSQRHKLTFWEDTILAGEVFGAHQFVSTQRWIADAL
jgi:hypothetical protein